MRLGNDPEQLDLLARRLGRVAAELGPVGPVLRREFAITRWSGPDRERMAADVDHIGRVASRTGSRVRALALVVQDQAASQRRASENDLGESTPPSESVWYSDDRGDGRRIVAVGDVESATNVVVIVPGMGTTAANFGGVRGDAVRLQRHAAAMLGDEAGIAVVAWLGYDAPAGLDHPIGLWEVLTAGRAREGATELAVFLDQLPVRSDAKVTVIGHSYGSLVAALAVRNRPGVDQLVLLGSPGVGADDVIGLHLAPETRVFAAALPNDPVAKTEWFGEDPARPHFGAMVLDTHPWDEASGPSALKAHSAYFDEDSQFFDNLVTVMAGGTPRRIVR